MVREILTFPDPRLKLKARPVVRFDAELLRLIDDMAETMYRADGIGLAATQIGEQRRVLVIDTSPRDPAGPGLIAFVNPEIQLREGTQTYTEGCLSIPGEAEEVVRAARVKVRAQDRAGGFFDLDAEGLLAVALQHEIDHLDGVLFVDHLSSLKRELIRRRMKRRKAEAAAERTAGAPAI